MVVSKACSACGQTLSAAAFNNSAKSADGLARMCRACINTRRRQRKVASDRRSRTPSSASLLATGLRQGDFTKLQTLLRAGAVPQWSWICETMREGHLAVAEWLLESGAKRNSFTMAAMGNVKALTRKLKSVPADARIQVNMEPASTQVTPLHVGSASDWRSHGPGCMTAQVHIAMTLVEHGADPNAVACYRGIGNATPLLCACWTSGNLELVRWLLNHGAPCTDASLMAALGHLQRHGQAAYDIAEHLLAWGLPVDGAVPGSRTPLQAFAHQADHRTVSWLIAHGANVNARGPGGRTAAHFAAERNTSPTTIALLIENGADPNARDDDGRKPMEIARLNGKVRLVEWMAKHVRGTGRSSS